MADQLRQLQCQAVYYLCLYAGLEPLLRDCACQGTDAGFVHLSCHTNFAIAKSKQARDTVEFVTLWVICPSCNQHYLNELAVDIATKFVSFVRRQYPDADDTQMQVESLDVKRAALMAMFHV
jgi:hypothetical protein